MSDKYPVITLCRVGIIDPMSFCIKPFGIIFRHYTAVLKSPYIASIFIWKINVHGTVTITLSALYFPFTVLVS